MHWSTWNYTWQPATFCAALLYCSWQRALKGTFISLITKLVLDLMREICPFICAFSPSSSSYLKKKKKISITKALYISSLLLMMWPFAPIYLHGNKPPPPPPPFSKPQTLGSFRNGTELHAKIMQSNKLVSVNKPHLQSLGRVFKNAIHFSWLENRCISDKIFESKIWHLRKCISVSAHIPKQDLDRIL